MQRRFWTAGVISLLLLGGVAASGVEPAPAGDVPASRVPHAGAAGVRAYIDPHTGELAVPPAGVEAPAQVNGALRRGSDDDDMVAVPSTGSAGGFMINTKGRFAASIVAMTDSAGKTTAQCEAGIPEHSSRPNRRHE